MRTIVDLTEESSSGDPSAMPSPASVGEGECDAVCIQLRELEISMTFEQVLAVTDALNAWRFRGCGCGGVRCGTLDLGEEDLGLDHELEVLRGIVRDLADDNLVDENVPPGVVAEVRKRLGAWHGQMERWAPLRERLLAAETKIRDLEAQLAAARKARRRS